jgi:putative addiction module killer protein
MLAIRYYVKTDGRSPFADWFAELDGVARAKITRAITRFEQGNLGNVKSVGEGVLECKIDFGPGYRVYFGRRWRYAHYLTEWRDQKAPAARHRRRP